MTAHVHYKTSKSVKNDNIEHLNVLGEVREIQGDVMFFQLQIPCISPGYLFIIVEMKATTRTGYIERVNVVNVPLSSNVRVVYGCILKLYNQ
jgi:hypothetical protein